MPTSGPVPLPTAAGDLLVEIRIPDHDVHRDAYILVLVVEPVHQLPHRRSVPARKPVPKRELHGRSVVLAAAASRTLTDDRRVTRSTAARQQEQPGAAGQELPPCEPATGGTILSHVTVLCAVYGRFPSPLKLASR
jgi:hypothetical protein